MPYTPWPLQRIRRITALWLLLSWAVAYASPIVKPLQWHLVCGQSGPAWVVVLDSAPLADDDTPDCADCLPLVLAAGDARSAPAAPLPAALARERAPANTFAPSVRAPPARGPPLFSLDPS